MHIVSGAQANHTSHDSAATCGGMQTVWDGPSAVAHLISGIRSNTLSIKNSADPSIAVSSGRAFAEWT